MNASRLSRRQFVGGLSAAPVTAISTQITRADSDDAAGSPQGSPRIGLALGSGGANGLAHVLMLEALEEEGLRPHRIAGSSIGAVIGALYAGGMSTDDIRQLIDDFFISDWKSPVKRLLSDDTLRLVEMIEIDLGSGGILTSESLVSGLYEKFEGSQFEQLQIPLAIVAADLWSREQTVIESGELLPAVQASMAIPGVFHPILHNGQVLVDGGTVNPVPFDVMGSDCDVIIGIDVSGIRSQPSDSIPGYFETLFNSVKVMQQAIMSEKMKRIKPDIFIAPEIADVRALEFHKAKEVYRQAQPAKKELKEKLKKMLEKWPG